MKVKACSLGLAGVPAHEAVTIRFVQNALADNLDEPWRLVDHAEAEVVIADPNTTAGEEVLAEAVAGRWVIAILDRDAEPSAAPLHVSRPLRPAALVKALNRTRDAEDAAASG